VASSASLAAAPICQSNKVPMSPSSTNDEVTRKGDFIFRMCFVDSYQGENQAKFRREVGATRPETKAVAILTDVKSDYSQGLGKVFPGDLHEAGRKDRATNSYLTATATSGRTHCGEVGESSLISCPATQHRHRPDRQPVRDLGITVPLLAATAGSRPKLIEIGGKALGGQLLHEPLFRRRTPLHRP